MYVRIYFDGACDPNRKPHLMGVGVAVYIDEEIAEQYERSFDPGPGTNNIAEWTGLLEALRVANRIIHDHPKDDISIKIFGDSQLIVKQFNGEWEIKKDHFRPFNRKCQAAAATAGRRLKSVGWIRRDKNERADMLSKKALVPKLNKDK